MSKIKDHYIEELQAVAEEQYRAGFIPEEDENLLSEIVHEMLKKERFEKLTPEVMEKFVKLQPLNYDKKSHYIPEDNDNDGYPD
jgi:hypothetical protein